MFDTSAMLYIGNSVDRPGDDFISEKLGGLPIRGLRYTIERLVTATNDSTVIAVMDSKTNKHELYPDYKSQRTFNHEIFAQRELLKFLLPYLGITMLMQDNYEADDLFYNFIIEKYFISGINENIWLYCDDLDLVGCVMSDKISRFGLTKHTPLLTVDTYSTILHRSGKDIPYNCVLPYILFYGKQSNNLKQIKSVKPAYAFMSYYKFVTTKFNGKEALFSLKQVLDSWISYLKETNEFQEEFFNEIEERIPVVYPRLGYDKDKAFIIGKLENDTASRFLTILEEPNLIEMLGLKKLPYESVQKSILDKWIALYRSGTVHVDSGMTADESFYFSSDENINVGGF